LHELRAEVGRWADEMLALSPTALRFLKQSFNADSEHIGGVANVARTGNPGPLPDAVHTDRAVAVLGKQLERRIETRLSLVHAAEASRLRTHRSI